MIETKQDLELQIEAFKKQLSDIADLLSQERAPSPIIPLEVAASEYFQKKPSIVRKWVKSGLLRAYSIPDGRRGHYYYFLRDQLIEDIEHNFVA